MKTQDTESPFPSKTYQEWEALVAKGLKSGHLTDLMRVTEDGFTRGLLAAAQDCPSDITSYPRFSVPLRGERPWHICAAVNDSDLAFANTQVIDDLKGGASAIRVALSRGGLNLKKPSDIKRLLEGVYTSLVPISFAPSPHNADISAIMLEMDGLDDAHVNLGLNPVHDSDMIAKVIESAPVHWRVITIGAASVHDGGGTPAQELAFMAASAAHAMRKYGAQTAHDHMNIELATDQDAHANIAKIRAARRIYAAIAAAFDLTDTAVPIHAVTSARMMQSTDPWPNMLRVMSAGFGAVIGGADYITTRAFTDSMGTATPFGYRIARNMQLMMMEESHLGHVTDPAYGSYFHESLTDKLAKAAWMKFQSIEAQGGIEAYISAGTLSADIKAATEERAARDAPIVGVTLHPAPPLRDAKVRKAVS